LQERSPSFQTVTPVIQQAPPVIIKQKIEQAPIQLPPPVVVQPTVSKTPTTPPVQPCSRRVGCEDSQSNNPNSNGKE
jgi:hypothetical protein